MPPVLLEVPLPSVLCPSQGDGTEMANQHESGRSALGYRQPLTHSWTAAPRGAHKGHNTGTLWFKGSEVALGFSR